MKTESVHVLKAIDPPTLALIESVTTVAGRLDVPVLLIGAAARDLIFEYVHGVLTERATGDVDVAVLTRKRLACLRLGGEVRTCDSPSGHLGAPSPSSARRDAHSGTERQAKRLPENRL